MIYDYLNRYYFKMEAANRMMKAIV